MQREWKSKELKEEKEKMLLMKSIQYKAARNDEKDQVQAILNTTTKGKKYYAKAD